LGPLASRVTVACVVRSVLTRSPEVRSKIAAMPTSNYLKLVTLFFILVAAAPSFAGGKSTSLSEAKSAIEANLKTPEGKSFEDRMGKEFIAKHMDPLRQCKASSGGDMTNFWILFRLDRDGAVEEILLHPETKLGTCARDAYMKDKLLSPPHPEYWFGVYLQLSH